MSFFKNNSISVLNVTELGVAVYPLRKTVRQTNIISFEFIILFPEFYSLIDVDFKYTKYNN